MKYTKLESEMTLIETRLIELENLSIYGLTIKEEIEERELSKRMDFLRAKRERNIKNYKRGKANTRTLAIEWQANSQKVSMSWGEIVKVQDAFRLLAKRYGLIKEFKENGIL